MLMTVLKGELAINQSKALIRLFKSMKDYIVENNSIYNDNFYQLIGKTYENNKLILEHEKSIEKIKKEMLSKKELSKIIKNFMDFAQYKEFLILNGKSVEADIAYNSIYSQAKKSIFIIDNYIGLKTLVHLKNIENVEIHIFSSNINKLIHQSEIEDFKNEYPKINIHFNKMSNIIHDRYIILDYS